jgi:predicted negative regulator of RcsB-dependent stress response
MTDDAVLLLERAVDVQTDFDRKALILIHLAMMHIQNNAHDRANALLQPISRSMEGHAHSGIRGAFKLICAQIQLHLNQSHVAKYVGPV